MITTKEIKNLGWKHIATAKNGGSKSFSKDSKYVLTNHSDNFIFQESNDERLNEIEIEKIENRKLVSIYKGSPSLEELILIFDELDIFDRKEKEMIVMKYRTFHPIKYWFLNLFLYPEGIYELIKNSDKHKTKNEI
jgi:hypothetical protein